MGWRLVLECEPAQRRCNVPGAVLQRRVEGGGATDGLTTFVVQPPRQPLGRARLPRHAQFEGPQRAQQQPHVQRARDGAYARVWPRKNAGVSAACAAAATLECVCRDAALADAGRRSLAQRQCSPLTKLKQSAT